MRRHGPAPDAADRAPKAPACYGLLRGDTGGMLRFFAGCPVSQVTEDFLAWDCARLAVEWRRVPLLVWDNASWHVRRLVRARIEAHNRRAKAEGGVRIVACWLPVKTPWLNANEPKWVHGKRAIVEPDRKLTDEEVVRRVCSYYGCEPLERLDPPGRARDPDRYGLGGGVLLLFSQRAWRAERRAGRLRLVVDPLHRRTRLTRIKVIQNLRLPPVVGREERAEVQT